MQALARQVYIEEQYPGVTLGVIALPHGLIQIDAPPSPEDARSWRAALLGLNCGVERLLVNLDGHPDRTLGARAMDCTIAAHERTAEAFRNRPNTFKAQGEETGSDWESVVGLGNIRWAPPDIAFTYNFRIEWSNYPVIMEHHPGPTNGACWIILPEDEIVFIGDLAVKNQTPFLANAILTDWISSLNYLRQNYVGYTLVSGRGGVIQMEDVDSQIKVISYIHEKLESLAKKQGSLEDVEALIPDLMAMIEPKEENIRQFTQRLFHGLRHYYARHYRHGNIEEAEE